MKKAGLETIVGVFMLIGLLCLAWLSIRLGHMELFGSGDHYPVNADFDSVSGLRPGAPVEIAGVSVGRVGGISYDAESRMAKVRMEIRRGVTLYDDVIASVNTSGIIGDKFIKLKPGGSDRPLTPGGKIRDTESAVDLEELISKYIHGNVK